MSKKIKSICIVGGGSSGWMSAATFATQLPNIDVTIIESPDFPILGVGESTLGGIKHWSSLIGLEDKDLLTETDGSYKLSIKFTDWLGKDTGGFHYPFGEAQRPIEQVAQNDWWFLKGNRGGLDQNSFARCHYPVAAISENNKMSDDSSGKTPGFSFVQDVAFHFDATALGQYLKKKICLPKGVKLINSTVEKINTNDDGIESLILQNKEKVTADLYIDCTGFKSLLLEGALGVKFNSIENIIPNNKAWATHIPYTDKNKQLEPFTNCTALSNGWTWNIPLWSRIGAGYVYSDKYISDDEALEEFKDYIRTRYDNVPIEDLEFKPITMRNGIHEKTWEKNVVAIGLSSGFVEPLESTGLMTTYEWLLSLIYTLRKDFVNQWDRDAFNYALRNIFYGHANFVGMHYALSSRDDTPYWQDVTERVRIDPTINNSLNYETEMGENLELLYYATSAYKYHQFREGTAGFQCVAAGMNYSPIDAQMHRSLGKLKGFDPEMHCDRLQELYRETQQKYINYAETLPSLYEYLCKTIHDSSGDMTFVGTEDDVPQHIYDSMPDRVKMKVKKQERKTIEPSYRDKNPKWTQRPKGFVTYE
jgi:tryptophan halogenase